MGLGTWVRLLGAARIVHHREIANADDPAAELQARADEMRQQMEPSTGEALAYLDEVIDPAQTRPRVIRAIQALRRRRP